MPPRSDKAKLIEKIKALLAKTVANGCTEGEACAALEKTRALMADYEISHAELNFADDPMVGEARHHDDRDRIRSRLGLGVATFCQVACWRSGFDTVTFFGCESDVFFAHWLLDTLADYVERAKDEYLAVTRPAASRRVRRIETNGFIFGCVSRLVERLSNNASHTDVAKAKAAAVEGAKADLGLDFEHRRRFVMVDPTAENSGRAAADQATFDRPINDGGPVLRLPSSL
jgi:hypothetical protein